MKIEDKDVTFTVPDTWEDRSVTAFARAANPDHKVPPNVIVTREKANGGEDLASYAHRQLVQNAKTIHQFVLLAHTQASMDGTPAIVFDFTWRHEVLAIHLRQKQVIFQRGSRMVSVIFTATEEDYEEVAKDVDAILSSAVVRSA